MRCDVNVYTPKFHGLQFFSLLCAIHVMMTQERYKWIETNNSLETRDKVLSNCYSISQWSSFSELCHIHFNATKGLRMLLLWSFEIYENELFRCFPFIYWIKYIWFIIFSFFLRRIKEKKCILKELRKFDKKPFWRTILLGGNLRENYIYASSISRVDPNEIHTMRKREWQKTFRIKSHRHRPWLKSLRVIRYKKQAPTIRITPIALRRVTGCRFVLISM